ncbi:hypothetical protein SAMN04487949_0474 [Halogranum gelatinilyticum]|uniref:Uncharacterized protein n=1 Tax=Halogranum gelatinilyticum TaxID=660521 RepID=A0A1G9PPM2_9EURY|nr:DUF6663 family protein [Halogranum gelatinilyticum]SDM00756.1 hypothetical protein SAMN04487949_0474 [Halogranum gelatinilyticum]
MELTTSGRFRVLDSPRERPELLLIDLESLDPTYVRTDGYDSVLDDIVAGLRPGFVVEATLAWTEEGTPRFSSLSVDERTRIEFVDDVTGLFEAARETWQNAEADNEGMNSRVTYDTDGAANGVLYVFAEQPGARDIFEEFKSGVLPLEPLIDRVNENRDDDDQREVFVMRPADDPFVVVYIVFAADGMLANTVRDTYDCPRE